MEGVTNYLTPSNKYYFLTNTKNLLSILSSGAVQPSGAEFRHSSDSRDQFGGAIPLFKAGVPSSLFSTGGFSDDDVVIEFGKNVLGKLKPLFGGEAITTGFVIPGPVPIKDVSAFLFSSQKALDGFLLRLFDEVPVDKSLFGVTGDGKILPGTMFDETHSAFEAESDDVVERAFLMDKAVGGIATVCCLAPTAVGYGVLVEGVSALCIKIAGKGHIDWGDIQIFYPAGSGCVATAGDLFIFESLQEVCLSLSPEDGFDPAWVIGEVRQRLEDSDITSEVEASALKWCGFVEKVISGDAELAKLADTGSPIQRGALLFLLRPSVGRIEGALESGLRPGPVVFSIAAMFSGLYTGATRLGSAYKGGYGEFVNLVDFAIRSSAKVLKGGRPPKSIVEVESKAGSIEGVAHFRSEKNTLYLRDVSPDPLLARVYFQCKSSGYKCSYDYYFGEVRLAFSIANGGEVPVRIKVLGPSNPGKELVRISASCFQTPKSGKLNKDMANGLLFRNNQLDMHCRFAIDSQKKEVVVQVDQLLSTMEDSELEFHLAQISRIAGDFGN